MPGNTVGKFFFCLLWISTFFLGGCQSTGDTDSEITFDWSFSPDSPEVGPATLFVTITDTTGQVINGAEVTFEANMSHPGMTPVIGDLSETEPGHYSGDMSFTMAGDWYILLEATLPDEKVVDYQIDIPGVRSQ